MIVRQHKSNILSMLPCVVVVSRLTITGEPDMQEGKGRDMRSGEFIQPDGKGGIRRVPSYETILEEARLRFEAYESTIDHLVRKVDELEDETYADTRLAEMRDEVERSRKARARGFSISDAEWDDIHAWQKSHIDEAHGGDEYAGAIGGRWTYSFIPTSIGVIGTVVCACGAEHTFQELS